MCGRPPLEQLDHRAAAVTPPCGSLVGPESRSWVPKREHTGNGVRCHEARGGGCRVLSAAPGATLERWRHENRNRDDAGGGGSSRIRMRGEHPDSSMQEPKPLRVVSEQTATGFAFPESVAYDPAPRPLRERVRLRAEAGRKDGKGRISGALRGRSWTASSFRPGERSSQAQGNLIEGNRLWVTDNRRGMGLRPDEPPREEARAARRQSPMIRRQPREALRQRQPHRPALRVGPPTSRHGRASRSRASSRARHQSETVFTRPGTARS